MPKKEKIIIIDGNALVHRAFHALPPTMKTKDGTITNAVYGFVTILFKVLKELKPQYAAVTFDVAKKTFRHKEFKEYKATRKKQAQELYDQFPIVKEIVKAFNIPIFEKVGFEADDLIGTITKKLDGDLEKFIVTGDLDALQLVDEKTKVFTMKKGVNDTIIYDIQGVKERYKGLGPEQMIDYKALRGDASDNIPGVRGIGEKGAIDLLKKYKTLENIYKNIDKITGATHDKLKAGKADAKMSKKLATIVRDMPLKINLKDCLLEEYKRDEVFQVLQKYEFKTLLTQVQNVPQFKAQQSLFAEEQTQLDDSKDYNLVDTSKKLKTCLKELKKQKIFALDTETDSLDFINNKLVGLSFSWKKDQAYFVLAKFLKDLKPILEDEKIKKVGQNIKFDLHSICNAGVTLKGIEFDTMLASYLLNPGSRQHSLDKLAFAEFGHSMISFEDLCGKGKAQIPITEVPLDKLNYYACEDADYTWQLYEKLSKELKEKKLAEILKLEVPLIKVLAEMEYNGVALDEKFLAKMSKSLATKIKTLESKIYKLAGIEFNIASPKQLKEILFEKLELNPENIKKGKTGYSTAASELAKMKDEHEIIPLIEDYRELTKLKSTYTDALPKLMDQKTKRVHTSFNQTITATGRLSSSDPNLQNIPVRTELGKEIRKAFVAPDGYKLVALDYSQVELRIVAHLANDEKMLQAFKDGADIHQKTADEIGITRREAKAINFGVIYGMGSYGLAQDTGMSQSDARAFMEQYFALYEGVARFMEETKEIAREKGYVETLFGRIRNLPDINSGIFQVRQAAERMAINMPVQGTAADIMKMAMLKVQEAIEQKKIKAKMILQVHDELVFEIKTAQTEVEAKKIQTIMEDIFSLKCPLKVDIKIGKNWRVLE